MKRIKYAMKLLGIKNVKINQLENHLQDQYNQFTEICNHYQTYRLFKDPIEESKEIIKKEELQEHCEYIMNMNTNTLYGNENREQIRHELRQIEYLPLRIKRYFNIARMDHYTMFITS